MGFVKTRLGAMMFLQYVIWGSWYVTLNTYLTSTLHFSGTEAGAAFGTVSIACLVSPFFVGLVADRFFSTERVMAALYALGAVFMILLSRATTFPGVYTLLLAFCLCYFPTVALSNSIAMQQVKNPGRDFPPIRVMGTLGWIAVNLVIGFMRVEADITPFLIAAGACAGDVRLQPRGAAAYATASARSAGDDPPHSRARCAGHAERSFVLWSS